MFYLFVCTEVTLVDNISFKYTTLQFDFCIHYSVLTIKNLVSIRHHIFNLFLSISPFLHLVTTNLLSVSMGLFLFCLFLSLGSESQGMLIGAVGSDGGKMLPSEPQGGLSLDRWCWVPLVHRIMDHKYDAIIKVIYLFIWHVLGFCSVPNTMLGTEYTTVNKDSYERNKRPWITSREICYWIYTLSSLQFC